MHGHEHRTAGRPRRRLRSLVAWAATVTVGLGVAATVPAVAVPPEGARFELLLGPSGFHGSRELAVNEGEWGTVDLARADAAPSTPVEHGCPDGDTLQVAFAPASEAPGVLGSAERPAATAGALATKVFAWAGQQPLDSDGNLIGNLTELFTDAEWDQMVAANGNAEDYVGKFITRRWPAGTLVSLVLYCSDGMVTIPGYFGGTTSMPTVDVDETGHAITSWLQFRTVASTSTPSNTSAGFAVVAPKMTPTVALSDVWQGTTGTLTATLTGADDAVLTDATGTVEFFTVAGGTRTSFGSTEVAADGTADVDVSSLAPGSETVFEAAYTPDATAAETYTDALSSRYTVFGAEAPVAPTVGLSVKPTSFGRAGTAVVQVTRSGAAATGTVSVTVDGAKVGSATLAAGRASVPLPAGLHAGGHTVAASYAGNDTTGPGSASARLSVAKAATALGLKLTPKTATVRKTRVTAAITVTAPGLTPTGTVVVKVGATKVATVTLKAGRATVRLPKLTKPGKTKVSVTYAGTADLTGASRTATVTVKKAKR